jgi:PKD domain-containing protein
MVARSKDHGATWDNVIDLSQSVGPAIVASTFQTVVAGDPDRVAVAYLGTQVGSLSATTTPFDTGFDGVWHLFVSISYDGGKSWRTVRVTDDPVQRGCIWDQGGVNDCRNLLDFMDAQLTKDGRVVVGFADGCELDCAAPEGTAAQSTSAYATLARQSAGPGLFAQYDSQQAAPAPAQRSNRRPRACLRVRAVKLRVTVDGRCSTDADGFVRRYRWSWGDGKHASSPTARHSYKRRGRYRITLTVTDDRGGRSAAGRKRVKLPARPPKHREFGEPDGH